MAQPATRGLIRRLLERFVDWARIVVEDARAMNAECERHRRDR